MKTFGVLGFGFPAVSKKYASREQKFSENTSSELNIVCQASLFMSKYMWLLIVLSSILQKKEDTSVEHSLLISSL